MMILYENAVSPLTTATDTEGKILLITQTFRPLEKDPSTEQESHLPGPLISKPHVKLSSLLLVSVRCSTDMALQLNSQRHAIKHP